MWKVKECFGGRIKNSPGIIGCIFVVGVGVVVIGLSVVVIVGVGVVVIVGEGVVVVIVGEGVVVIVDETKIKTFIYVLVEEMVGGSCHVLVAHRTIKIVITRTVVVMRVVFVIVTRFVLFYAVTHDVIVCVFIWRLVGVECSVGSIIKNVFFKI